MNNNNNRIEKINPVTSSKSRTEKRKKSFDEKINKMKGKNKHVK